MVLVDFPIYRHNGRMWCHMVSDTSLEELHAFAESLGVPRKGFHDHPGRNHPHYDLPADVRELAIERGAVAVSGRELVERMVRHPDRPHPRLHPRG